ncbi:TPA: hypothetical protein NH770_005142 [Pseudomonas aeruginosa]|nr:hypothetical protein [Pseudomonas aeruginosa]HBO4175287.1 hypothetical protein [Pseudomonas aeruginosa]HCF1083885.1 hypothetical protein [Pseudomonas aeruginosa]
MAIGTTHRVTARGGTLTVQPKAADMAAFSTLAAAYPKAAMNAQRRAINKTLGWLRTHIARAVGQKERIAVRAVRQRLIAYPVRGSGTQGKLWFGINPIEASRIGRPRQGKAGVTVAGRTYRGAFYARVYGGEPDIWIRTASPHFDPSDYPASDVRSMAYGRRGSMDADMYGRFPLAKAKVLLDDMRPLFDAWAKRADQKLLEFAQRELAYELHKLTKGGARG